MIRSTFKLRFRWHGDPPCVGHFLKSPRGRTAYEILEIKFAKLSGQAGSFKVCRWEPREVPTEATVHEWKWDKRGPSPSSPVTLSRSRATSCSITYLPSRHHDGGDMSDDWPRKISAALDNAVALAKASPFYTDRDRETVKYMTDYLRGFLLPATTSSPPKGPTT